MALIKCSECGKEISDKAKTCPNCGCPLNGTEIPKPAIPREDVPPAKAPKKRKYGCLVSIIIFLFLAFIVGMLAKAGAAPSIVKGDNTTATTESPSETLAKEDAQSIDNDIWGYVYPVITANNDLMAIMSNYSSGKVSELDLYNAAKAFKDYTQSAWASPPAVSDENGKKYLSSCKDYITFEEIMAKSILKYLDSKKTSDLSKVQENIEQCKKAVQIVASNRGTFLGLNNFTQEEIKKIVEDSMQ